MSATKKSWVWGHFKSINNQTASCNHCKSVVLEANGEKSQRLEKLYLAAKSIKPTSTDCEQAFSIAGSFKTKIRNRLTPKMLNILVWLKYYFVT